MSCQHQSRQPVADYRAALSPQDSLIIANWGEISASSANTWNSGRRTPTLWSYPLPTWSTSPLCSDYRQQDPGIERKYLKNEYPHLTQSIITSFSWKKAFDGDKKEKKCKNLKTLLNYIIKFKYGRLSQMRMWIKFEGFDWFLMVREAIIGATMERWRWRRPNRRSSWSVNKETVKGGASGISLPAFVEN